MDLGVEALHLDETLHLDELSAGVARRCGTFATVSRSVAGDLSLSLGRLSRGDTGGSRTLGAFGE